MKKKLLDALKTKFVGVKEDVLNRIADKLAKTVTDEAGVQTAVDGVDFQQVLDSYGDARATQATETAVKNYESKYNLKDGKTIETPAPKPEPPTPGPAPQPGGDVNAQILEQLKTMAANQKTLTDELNAMKQEKIVNSRKSQFDAVLAKAPENIKTRYEKDFARMTFKDDEDFSGWLEEIKPDIEKLSAQQNARGAAIHTPKGGGPAPQNVTVDPMVQARADARAAADAHSGSVIQGMPQAAATTPTT